MPRRATRMPLDLSEDSLNLIAPMTNGPTGLDQVQEILRRYERDNFNAFVRGLEPPRTQDPLDLPPVTGSSAPFDTSTLTPEMVQNMMDQVVEANERAERIQREVELRRRGEIEEHQRAINDQLMNRARAAAGRPSRNEPWHAEIMGEMPPLRDPRPETLWGHPVDYVSEREMTNNRYAVDPDWERELRMGRDRPMYVERERVLPRQHRALITTPRSTFQTILRDIQHMSMNAIQGSYRSPEHGSIWGIPIRISDSGAIQMPIMEVTDGVRSVAMQFPERVLMDPNQLSDFQRELRRRLDYEHERAGDEQLASKALPYGFHTGRKVNRKQKVRSLVYEKED